MLQSYRGLAVLSERGTYDKSRANDGLGAVRGHHSVLRMKKKGILRVDTSVVDAYNSGILHDGEGLIRPKTWTQLSIDQHIYFDMGTLRYEWRDIFGLGIIIEKEKKFVKIQPDEGIALVHVPITRLDCLRLYKGGFVSD